MIATSAIADRLNRTCHCVGTDLNALQSWIDGRLRQRGIDAPIVSTHPHLFAQSPIFVAREHADRIGQIVAAIEAVTRLPKYRERVLSNIPSIAGTEMKARGVFTGYDFHITSDGPKLIEINTNAGGAMLNIALMRAQQACCPEVLEYLRTQPDADALERVVIDMFRHEWALARGAQPLQTIALVDDQPKSQFLYPEFVLFQKLFQEHGIHCAIAAPEDLEYKNGVLRVGGLRIDLVYNRLTNFFLQGGSFSPLVQAMSDEAAVLTPHPHAYALYADKRNLAVLSSSDTLREFGASETVIAAVTSGVPRTLRFDAASPEAWWNRRKAWFFKPATGFGSRGTYKGEKLTRKVFAELSQGDYVAQELVAPSERNVQGNGASPLKFDIRAYTYDGRVQFLAARLYQGQTTNFRTPSGGFAPIYLI